MRTERGQRVAAAWAVRGQPYPAVGAELPVSFDLTAAITALLHELVKLLMELQERGLPPALLGRWLVLLVVHGVPSVSHCLTALVSHKKLYAQAPIAVRGRCGICTLPGPPRLFFHQHFKPVGTCAGDSRARFFFSGHFIPAPFFNEGTSLVGTYFL
jgi:hypothetical protein